MLEITQFVKIVHLKNLVLYSSIKKMILHHVKQPMALQNQSVHLIYSQTKLK